MLAAAAKHSLAVSLLCTGRLEQVLLAARNPSTRIVIDHLGLHQPLEPPPPAQPWADLPKVVGLATHPNAAIKINGACTLSREQFPYRDIWSRSAGFDAFGLDRCTWGIDWTRAIKLLTYAEGVDAFRLADRLSDGDHAELRGGTLSRVYNWSPERASVGQKCLSRHSQRRTRSAEAGNQGPEPALIVAAAGLAVDRLNLLRPSVRANRRLMPSNPLPVARHHFNMASDRLVLLSRSLQRGGYDGRDYLFQHR